MLQSRKKKQSLNSKLHYHPFTGLQRTNSTTCSQFACYWIGSKSAAPDRRGHGFESRTSLNFFSGFLFASAKVVYVTAMIILHLISLISYPIGWWCRWAKRSFWLERICFPRLIYRGQRWFLIIRCKNNCKTINSM